MRFLVEIYDAVRAAVGPEFPVGVKLNSSDFQDGGFNEDESLEVARALDGRGVDLIEVSGGSYVSPAMMGEGSGGFFTDYARRLVAAVEAPVILTGGFRTGRDMEDALEQRAADLIGLARPLVVEPELPQQVLRGSVTDPVELPRIRTGLGAIDRTAGSMLMLSWYEMQMRRLARGKPSTTTAGGLAALWNATLQHGPGALTPRSATKH